MRKRREINPFSISFLDLITGALGAVIILYVAVPKKTVNDHVVDTQIISRKDEVIQSQSREIEKLKELLSAAQAANVPVAPAIPEPVEDSGGLDVGFKFKGKKIVFIVDTSRSMIEEDRMGQIKAGLKMLITSMPPSFSVDIIQFPNGRTAPFKPLFKKLHGLDKETKLNIFDFIYSMKPEGATPTRDAMKFAFQNYLDMSDLVLLTDGEPSLHESPLKDDIHDLLGTIRNLNRERHVQINTIGVGEEVLHDKTANPYQFLKLLAEQNVGFFVGF